MPDRYEPKLSVRPPGERRAADVPADGDPLAELARMVSGRPSVEPMTARGGEPDDASSDADIEQKIREALVIKEPGHKINLDDFKKINEEINSRSTGFYTWMCG